MDENAKSIRTSQIHYDSAVDTDAIEVWRQLAPRAPEPISVATAEIWDEICALDLAPHIAEIEVKGYTVIPPEKNALNDMSQALYERILDVAEKRKGVRPDPTGKEKDRLRGSILEYMLFEGQEFERAITNRTILTLVDYLVGRSAIIANVQANLKSQNRGDLHLHSDNVWSTQPFASWYQLCNVNWILTDYCKENGGICFVPGSHKYGRRPLPGEGYDHRVWPEAPAGSLIAFTGDTWHGGVDRENPGIRVNLQLQYVRPHLRPFSPYREDAPQEVIDRNPPRFARLLGKHLNDGWRAEGAAFSGFDVGTAHVYA